MRRGARAKLRDAARGMATAWSDERAGRIALCVAVSGTIAAPFAAGTPAGVGVLIGASWLVAVAELANTAIERAVDHGGDEWSATAREAKDLGAAATLAASAAGVLAWAAVAVWPRL